MYDTDAAVSEGTHGVQTWRDQCTNPHSYIPVYSIAEEANIMNDLCVCVLVSIDLESGCGSGQSLRAVCFYYEGIVSMCLVYNRIELNERCLMTLFCLDLY